MVSFARPVFRPLARSLVTVRSWPFFTDLGVAFCALAMFSALVSTGVYWMGKPIPVVTISNSVAVLPLYAFGAQLREVHPVVPLAAGHSVGIAIFSYNGLVTFGVIADSESTPDIDVLAHGIDEGVEDLLVLAAAV